MAKRKRHIALRCVVLRCDGGWIVRGEEATTIHSTKAEAMTRARDLALGRRSTKLESDEDRFEDEFGFVDIVDKSEISEMIGAGKAIHLFPSEKESHSEQPSIDIWIDPGSASSEDLAELYSALSELHRAHGGIGVDFLDDGTKVYSLEEVLP